MKNEMIKIEYTPTTQDCERQAVRIHGGISFFSNSYSSFLNDKFDD